MSDSPRPHTAPTDFDLATLFEGRPPRTRLSPFYALGLVLVALVMLLLPAVYLLVVAAAGWLLYWHATENASILSAARGPGALKFAVIAYAGPLFIGLVGVLFLIKPLFAPKARRPEPFTLSPSEEPRLFQFVEVLCNLMGAPVPSRIDVNCDVNASASYRGGVLSLLGNDLVLTIGLPLVAGLSLRELTGILAHEFGHFTQGWAMRLSYFIRGVNAWFFRVVYHRDAWDEQLDEWKQGTGHWAATLVVLAAAMLVGLSRLILKLLMYAGFAVSAFLTRQQEYDADAWEAGVAGSETAVGSSRKMLHLSVSQGAAFSEVQNRWRSGSLPDNLIGLLLAAHAKLPDEVRRAVDDKTRASRTAWYDTHPATPQRDAHVRKLNLPGVFRGQGPASILFRDFEEVCRKASYLHYRLVLGEKLFDATLIPTTGVVQQLDARERRRAASSSYLGGLISPLAPLAFSEDLRRPPADPAAALAELRACRAALAPLLPRVPDSLANWIEADDRLDVLAAAQAVIDARLILVAMRFKLPDNAPATLASETAAAQARAHFAKEAPAAAAPLLARRMELALSILRLPDAAKRLPDAHERALAVDRLLDLYAPLAESLRNLWPCHRLRSVAGALAQAIKRDEEGPRVAVRLRDTGEQIHRRLRGVRELLAGLTYTPPEEPQRNLAAWVLPTIPPADALPALFEVSGECQNQLLHTYHLVLTDLSQHAQALETALGLPQLTPTQSPTPASTTDA